MPQHCCSLSPWWGNNGAGKAQVQQNQGGRRNFSQASEKGGRVKPGPLSKEAAYQKSSLRIEEGEEVRSSGKLDRSSALGEDRAAQHWQLQGVG